MIKSIFAEGETSFNPQPTARNLTKPARMLRLGPSRLGARPCILVFLLGWVACDLRCKPPSTMANRLTPF